MTYIVSGGALNSTHSDSGRQKCCCRENRMSKSEYQDEAVVHQLKQQLHEKDLRLTDIQLEALSSAHQLEQLCETMNRMKVWCFRSLSETHRGDLLVPRTRLQLGDPGICVAGLVALNSLSLHIRCAPTLSTFKNMLKTHLFSRSYFTD